MQAPQHEWWRGAVIYQVYPRSFQDSDGDGIGDLRGIISRLDYLNDGDPDAPSSRSLGVDAIWLSPIFPSPMRDFGYDVSDYCDIDPTFGTLQDFDALLAAAHERGIRVLIDFVLNHTSDQHPWFQASRSSRSDPRRDWYIWRAPAPDGGPPDAMQAVFGGSAWQLDPATGEYYLHSFLPEQPDLNWQNAGVVAAMTSALRFWLRRGVDGVRLDAVPKLVKHLAVADDGVVDASRSLAGTGRVDPAVLDHLQPIRAVLDEFPGAVALAEAFAPPQELARLYGDDRRPGVHLAFDFQFIRVTSKTPLAPWDARHIAEALEASAEHLPAGALASYAFSNHDVPRFGSRHDHDGRGAARVRAAVLLQLALRGVPCIYYGDELGLVDAAVPESARLDAAGRDAVRTPMPWDDSSGRGFTSGTPWLPAPEAGTSAAVQRDDPRSTFSLYRDALRIRRAQPSLRRGLQHLVGARDGVLVVQRAAEDAPAVVVAVNTSTEVRVVDVPSEARRILLTSDPDITLDISGEASRLVLPPLAACWLA